MTERKLFDNLYKVIHANSGGMPAAQVNVLTEILDLQIPRGYCARIRKVIFMLRNIKAANQADTDWMVRGALVADPDDEITTMIPTFTIDHDVIADYTLESTFTQLGATGLGYVTQTEKEINFDETLDIVTVRNLRFNAIGYNFVEATALPQLDIRVYFTFEKISVDLFQKLLGIS